MQGTNSVGVGFYRRQSVEAIVLRACRYCGAPAVYKSSDDRNFDQWPGVLVPPDSPRVGEPIGRRCPNCQSTRDASDDEHLGEVWAKEFGGHPRNRVALYNAIRRFLRRIREWRRN